MAERLAEYAGKRDFRRTPEPKARKGRRKTGKADGRFVVQKHAASHLHYDFRLAIRGVLVSWAIPKGPSLDPTVKRLAVRTEDHPLDYADFEGVIPKGEYGAGAVMLWDRGTFRSDGDPAEGLAKGELKVTLEGERLRGRFALVRMKPRKGEKRENWLLIKERDDTADRAFDLEAMDTSVVTDRTMDAIAEGRSRARGAGQKRRGRAGAPPKFVAPQLATLVERPPTGKGWLYEPKLDGYRMIAAANGDRVRCYSRSGLDWTDRFAPIAEALRALDLSAALLDGEVVVVVDAAGRTDFSALQKALSDAPEKLSYQVFDCLMADGVDLRRRSNLERKEELARLLGDARAPVHVLGHMEGDGATILAHACANGLEGVVAKRAAATYRSRRVRDWLKIKCVRRQELVIGGWSPSTKRPFSSLLLGAWDGDALRYAGRVGTGFDDDQLERLAAMLAKRERKTSPFVDPPADMRRRARWVTPDLVAEVRYAEMTADGRVRHGVFLGLREDKNAREVRLEKPRPGASGASS